MRCWLDRELDGSEIFSVNISLLSNIQSPVLAKAKQKSPCIIFIDEIDSVGSKRVSNSIHPYANQTINQLLSEMDGFKQNEGVIVIGATNRMEDLDKALMRPGEDNSSLKLTSSYFRAL
jgi:ATP-dependent metalloprotease